MEHNEIEYRPWGGYVVLLDSEKCKVKKIVVAPQQRLSYQSHEHRREQWVVTDGVLTVVLEVKEHVLYPGDSINIPLGSKHRAWNKTDQEISFIEVQTGESFEEEDIIRYEDDWGRS